MPSLVWFLFAGLSIGMMFSGTISIPLLAALIIMFLYVGIYDALLQAGYSPRNNQIRGGYCMYTLTAMAIVALVAERLTQPIGSIAVDVSLMFLVFVTILGLIGHISLIVGGGKHHG